MNCTFYSFFTKYSILENYGFLPGLWSKITRKLVPEVAEEDKFEFFINQTEAATGNLDEVHAVLRDFLADSTTKNCIHDGLNAALSALSTKVIAFGLDHKLQAKFTTLEIDTSCYRRLIHELDTLLDEGKPAIASFRQTLEEAQLTITHLRQQKDEVGTSMHLTVTTKRILEYISRIQLLLDLKEDITNLGRWDILIRAHLEHEKRKNSIRRYLKAHTDTLALVVVEHTSQSGEQYVANDRQEYWGFFRKGLIGGLLISMFALAKIYLDSSFDAPLPSALVFSINYALCFVLVKVLGGTIATKQPAMTASTIIRHIDKNNTMRIGARKDIIGLLRKVSRSQSISLAGNFLMAFSMACLLAYLLSLGWVYNPIDEDKSAYLIKSVALFSSGAIYYAAVAGIFLALSGFISGYVDNRVIASNFTHRLQHHPLLTKITRADQRKKLTYFIEKKFGSIMGNISLGFLLGTAFLLSYLLPFKVDIRHVAFSSSNVGYAIVNHAYEWSVVVVALLQVLTIGLVNFIVSFSITFIVALKSRGATAGGLTKLILAGFKDFLFHPLDYLIFRKNKPQVEAVE